MGPTSYFQHRRDCQRKQEERRDRIAALEPSYHAAFSPHELNILHAPIDKLVQDVQSNATSAADVLRSYGKAAIRAHEKTNCLTEIMISGAEKWIKEGSINLQGPLAGIPVSLKDSINVAGYDTSVGYSAKTFKPVSKDGGLVRLLKDAGAVPFVKTALPITLLSFESTNDLWGRCKNPHNINYSPGGSTGGEGAILAFGGSRIGIGSDVAGSVRAPAHFSGCYSLRCSTGRWPKAGVDTSMPGQEGIPSVFSPMARTLFDLTYFSRALIQCKPWKYDHTVHPIEWREQVYSSTTSSSRKLRIGVLRTDGVIDPSPACARALQTTVEALQSAGHEIVELTPPPDALPYEALVIASQLLNADGTKTFRSFFRTGESTDPGASQMEFIMTLPSPIRYLYYLYVRYVQRDPIWAGLILVFSPKSAYQNWQLVARREAFKAKWYEWWTGVTFPSASSSTATLTDGMNGSRSSDSPSPPLSSATSFATLSEETKHFASEKEKAGDDGYMDAFLTVPNATPAVPHDGMKEAVSSCGYTFLFNLLDYSCGVLPVTRVDPVKDALPADFSLRKLNGVARGAYTLYDARKMAGLPVGVQIVGRRLEEEKVLGVMKQVEDALERKGERYHLMENF
ncbi:amidase signature domain-containing protein [Elsinoe ampelina]|uniref:amidase n=1 Tax=Elsinoe ampelina TaxID=302913 RepID=A0A6A6G779_9PEZI|nr:amidase signature domain-containing protein [Elsinoe ampelina]